MIRIHCFFFFLIFATLPIVSTPAKHRRAHFLLCRSVLPLSTGGELRGKRSPPRAGPLELMCQVGDLPISVFHHPPGLLFVMCLFPQCVPSKGLLLTVYFTMIFWLPAAVTHPKTACRCPVFVMHVHFLYV